MFSRYSGTTRDQSNHHIQSNQRDRRNQRVLRGLVLRVLTFILIFSFSVVSCGCSDMLKDWAINRVEQYTSEFIDSIAGDAINSISQNSVEEIDATELTKEQKEFLSDYLADIVENITVKKIRVNDARSRATVDLLIGDCFVFDDETLFIGTESELRDIVDGLERDDITLSLTLSRDGTSWIFDDLNELEDVLIKPFAELCFLDAQGEPINITEQYIAYMYAGNIVDGIWYDPIMGNPYSGNSISPTYYLELVFYFCEPTTMELTAELRCDGEAIETINVSMTDSVVLDCSFGRDFEQSGYGAGSYTVALKIGDTQIIESEALEVR